MRNGRSVKRKKKKPEVPAAPAVKYPKVLIPPACRCAKWPFAHVHEGEGKWEIVPDEKTGAAPATPKLSHTFDQLAGDSSTVDNR